MMNSRYSRRSALGLLSGAAIGAAGLLGTRGIASAQEDAALVAEAKREGRVVWYTTNGLELSQNVARAFSDKYGIGVEISRFVGASQYQRFMEETAAGQNITDIVNISDRPMMVSLADEGHLVEWKVPTHDRFPEQFRIGAHSYAITKTVACLIYNENKVSEEEARLLEASWKNVLDPRFKGRFAVTNQKSGLGYAGVQLMSGPDFPGDFFAQVAAQKPAVYSDLLVPIDRVVAGEHDFTFWSWDGGGSSRRAAGAPVRWVYPKPTPAFANNFFSVSAHAPNPNAGRLFLNWLASDEGAIVLQDRLGGSTTIEGVPDQRPFTKEAWFRPMTEVYDVDFERWAARYEEDYKPWIDALATI